MEYAVSEAEPLTGEAGAETPESLLEQAAKGQDEAKALTDAQERSVLDYLLAPPKPRLYGCRVTIDTDDGSRDMRAVFFNVRGSRIREIEKRHTKDGGFGPLSEVDDAKNAADLVWEALVRFEDDLGNVVDVKNDRSFRTAENGQELSGLDAVAYRFQFESGIVEALASEIRRVSGWGPDRVGTASRVAVDGVGGS